MTTPLSSEHPAADGLSDAQRSEQVAAKNAVVLEV
jgi:hypothetical protein